MEIKKRQLNVTDEANITLNEHGNACRVEMTNELSDVHGELSATFHYRIEKEAGLSTDDQTGEQSPIYCRTIIQYENPMDEETLAYAHMHYAVQLSDEQNIPFEYITPISAEEYQKEME